MRRQSLMRSVLGALPTPRQGPMGLAGDSTRIAGHRLSSPSGQLNHERRPGLKGHRIRAVALGKALMLTLVCAGCLDGNTTSYVPVAPTPPAPPAPLPPVTIVLFMNPETGVRTSDVHDAQGQIVQFNSYGELIWTATGSRFGGYPTQGLVVGDGSFEVRFGGNGSERRAYLTYSMDYFHYDPPPIVVDLEVVGDQLVVSDQKPPVPLPGS